MPELIFFPKILRVCEKLVFFLSVNKNVKKVYKRLSGKQNKILFEVPVCK